MQIDDMKKNIRKDSNFKIVLEFIAFTLFATLVGYISGTVMDNGMIKACLVSVCDVFVRYALHFYLALNIVMCSLCIGLYIKSKKLAENWDGEDEKQINKIEFCLDIVGSIISLTVIAGIMLWMLDFSNIEGCADSRTAWIIHTVLFSCMFGWIYIVRGKMMSFKQKLNCEDRIHVLDLRFERKYFESRDEGQKMIIYRATHDVFKGLSYINPVLMLIAFIGKISFDTGNFPVVIVLVAWLMEMMIYTRAVFKYKYRDKNRKAE
ncbi:MAG: DUF3169 family protein [Butyrivibrio sp.]|nr:DUF3169 family protein [Butyrivibrio sp.]